MKKYSPIIFICISFCFTNLANSQEIRFNSGSKQVALIELYTSQGCSSCPPADEWLGNLINKPGLWEEFVPIAFHVDYWDYLGWKDSFSKAKFSDRQRLHRKQGNVSVIYTPGFFLNGKEWKSRFGRDIPSLGNEAGVLSATLDGLSLKVKYLSSKSINNVKLNVAILGFGYQTSISAGENSNRVLHENFVLLSHKEFSPNEYNSTKQNWEMHLPNQVSPTTKQYALAIWVNHEDSLKPLQSTGGWLPSDYY